MASTVGYDTKKLRLDSCLGEEYWIMYVVLPTGADGKRQSTKRRGITATQQLEIVGLPLHYRGQVPATGADSERGNWPQRHRTKPVVNPPSPSTQFTLPTFPLSLAVASNPLDVDIPDCLIDDWPTAAVVIVS
jgi:hypothetical protein